jgi:hypothetical protein
MWSTAVVDYLHDTCINAATLHRKVKVIQHLRCKCQESLHSKPVAITHITQTVDLQLFFIQA